ncbi:MAG: AMP-binding protein [Timaviella obliquedivisa GSE-PSE-MK23-08B]|jgi:acyl-CoA synthetase (AMP-forming)/AMP-acid ligase II/acyl carrier protein|nr:AMP-binding protein [Timaviella obliquedivisa GSE-PSE-MK23-08B]
MSASEREMQPTLVDILRDRALRQPEQVAYTFLTDGETQAVSLTYRALARRVGAIAARLSDCCRGGDRALLLYPPGLDYVAAFLGCLSAGVVAVPAYPPRPNRSLNRLLHLVEDAEASVMLTTPEILAQLKQLPELQGLKGLAEEDWGEGELPDLALGKLAFLQYTSGSTDEPKGVMVSHDNLLHNLAAIQERFGYSDESCGVIWLPPYHDMGLIGGVLQPLYGGFPVVLMSPLMFMQSPVRWLRAIASYSATTSGGPSFAYEQCVQKIKPEQISDLDLSQWQVAFNGAEPIQAEILDQFAELLQPCGFRQEAFFPCYGLAEATLMVTGKVKGTPGAVKHLQKSALERHEAIAFNPQGMTGAAQTDGCQADCSQADCSQADCSQADYCQVVSCGQGLSDQELQIVHPETLQVLPDGQVGEIWVAGTSVAMGYWNREEETSKTFRMTLLNSKGLNNGGKSFLRTGDLGFLEGNELFVTGRLKDLLIIRGMNYYPQDIEKIVKNCHPSVSLNSGAAFTVRVEGVEQLVVMQEVNRTALNGLNANEVVGSIRQAISEHYDLQVYDVVLLKPGKIPRTSSGKIQRFVCRTSFMGGTLEGVCYWTNSTSQEEAREVRSQLETTKFEQPTELEIQDWLSHNLAIYLKVHPDEIDTSQPFAYYGLDSSVAVSLTGDLANWLHLKKLDPMLFWEYPNIEALAQHLVSIHL